MRLQDYEFTSRTRAEQGEELTQLLVAFVKAIDQAVTHERAKYPKYGAPDPSDVLIKGDLGPRVRLRKTLSLE